MNKWIYYILGFIILYFFIEVKHPEIIGKFVWNLFLNFIRILIGIYLIIKGYKNGVEK